MPSTDPHYHAKWVAKRRATFFEGKSCAKCNSAERLELDHIDPSIKVSHCIWSWCESRRIEEAKKCQILCRECHKKKSADYNSARLLGKPNMACRKLTNEQASEIRGKLTSGFTERAMASEYKVSRATIQGIKRFATYTT